MQCQAKVHFRQLGQTLHKEIRNPRCQAWASRMMGKPQPGPRPSHRVLELAREEADPSQVRVGGPAFLPPPTRAGLLPCPLPS